MKILFIARSTLYSAPGGDTIQIESTAKYLRHLGVSVDIALAKQQPEYAAYDLLHFFNIIRPADILGHVLRSGKPYVISTIFVDYSEYDKKSRGRVLRAMSKLFTANQIEYLKTLIRYVKNKEPINSSRYLWKGHKESILYLLKNAACLLPNSNSEYKRLQKEYGIIQRYKVIPNAIDIAKFDASKINPAEREGILCVARIEGLKNQLNLIRALKNTNLRLLLIGKPGPNHLAYYARCKEEAGSNVQFINHLSQETLINYYAKSRVHVLPSWFETTGLSSLEAAYMGCNIVITDKGDTREYFKDFAYYCNPDDISSILETIMAAYHAPYNDQLRAYIEQNYRWEITAKKTLEAYQEILGKEIV